MHCDHRHGGHPHQLDASVPDGTQGAGSFIVEDMVERIAHACAAHRRRTFVLWLVAAIALTVVAGSVHPKEETSDRLDGTDVQAAFDLVSAHLPSQGDESAIVVFRSDSDLRSSSNESAIHSVVNDIAALPRVADVDSPLDDTARFSPDGHIAFASVDFTPDDENATQDLSVTALSMQQIADRAPIEVAFGGDAFTDGEMPATELLGLLAAVVILLLAFGSVIAMGFRSSPRSRASSCRSPQSPSGPRS